MPEDWRVSGSPLHKPISGLEASTMHEQKGIDPEESAFFFFPSNQRIDFNVQSAPGRGKN